MPKVPDPQYSSDKETNKGIDNLLHEYPGRKLSKPREAFRYPDPGNTKDPT